MAIHRVSRRNFLKTSALSVGAASLLTEHPLRAAADQTAAPAAQPAGLPAPPPISAKTFASISATLDGISKATMEAHYRLYQGYVNKTNEIRQKLATADPTKGNQTYSDIRELKVELTFAVGGVKNHETYFGHLGGKGGKPAGALLTAIEKNFGSYDAWAADLKGTGLAARGWAWLAYDRDDGRLCNYLGDAQNTFPVWNAVPVLALDTYEHAYYLDYQTDRGKYIDAFMRNIDWGVVAANLEKAMK